MGPHNRQVPCSSQGGAPFFPFSFNELPPKYNFKVQLVPPPLIHGWGKQKYQYTPRQNHRKTNAYHRNTLALLLHYQANPTNNQLGKIPYIWCRVFFN
tara:strand:+ start:202 stop:495 length:294 start_codon:yes stop_codon:yes gene_type:complete